MKSEHLKTNILAAMFLCLGMVLPFLTGQIRQIGNMLLPMHIPVFLCGLICGWRYGLAVGVMLPILRSVAFGMPVMYPNAVAMAFELATYGFGAGFLYERSHKKGVAALYGSLLIAMVLGRVVWGVAELLLLGIGTKGFTWEAFLAGALLRAIPGILLQLIVIPVIMMACNKANNVS